MGRDPRRARGLRGHRPPQRPGLGRAGRRHRPARRGVLRARGHPVLRRPRLGAVHRADRDHVGARLLLPRLPDAAARRRLARCPDPAGPDLAGDGVVRPRGGRAHPAPRPVPRRPPGAVPPRAGRRAGHARAGRPPARPAERPDARCAVRAAAGADHPGPRRARRPDPGARDAGRGPLRGRRGRARRAPRTSRRGSEEYFEADPDDGEELAEPEVDRSAGGRRRGGEPDAEPAARRPARGARRRGPRPRVGHRHRSRWTCRPSRTPRRRS